jgi:hypothetical protein
MVQVIRPNKDGTSPKRERDAADGIQKAYGTRPKFAPVKPVPLKLKQTAVPDPPDL